MKIGARIFILVVVLAGVAAWLQQPAGHDDRSEKSIVIGADAAQTTEGAERRAGSDVEKHSSTSTEPSLIQSNSTGLQVEVAESQKPTQPQDEGLGMETAAAFLSQKLDLADPAKRAAAVKQLQQIESTRMAAVRRKAERLGIPLEMVQAGGAKAVLVGFDGDLPRYRIDHNVNAAISAGTNWVRNTAPFNVNGSGQVVGLWEVGGIPRLTHQEFGPGNRITVMDGTVAYADHATHVAGTIIGLGYVANALGMAPAASIMAYDANNDNAEMMAIGAAVAGESGKINISNHSYGFISGWYLNGAVWYWYGSFTDNGNPADDVETRYGRYDATSVAMDGLLYNMPYFLPFMSAGNSRNDGPPAVGVNWTHSSTGVTRAYDPTQHPAGDGVYKQGYDLLDNEKVCKNIITIGAANDAVSAGVRVKENGTLAPFSSTGPTDDGRIKPDVVANGVSLYSALSLSNNAYGSFSGTSMAAPTASGSAALLAEYFQKRFPGEVMRASTLKGLIIHTADDLGRTGPDYEYGWGLMNVKAAADLIQVEADQAKNQHITEQELPNGGSDTHRFTWDGANPIRVTLCWTDPAGSAFSSHDNRAPDLVNDLNVKVTGPDGVVYRPFVMPYVNDWSLEKLTALATTGINTVDNVEQVLIATPSEPGEYVVTVDHAGSLTYGSQVYSLIISGAVWPDALEVTPDQPLVADGFVGGPFSPGSKQYKVTNPSTQPLSWTATSNQSWVQVLPASGTLVAGAEVTVTVSLTVEAEELPAGYHDAEILFSDLTNETSATRQVNLTISSDIPKIVVRDASDQVLPDGGSLSFGSLPLNGGPTDRLLKLGNDALGSLLEVGEISLLGEDTDAFSVISSPAGATIEGHDSLSFLVRFSPRKIGPHTAMLRITSNDPENDALMLSLTALGTAVPGPEQEIKVARMSPRGVDDGSFFIPALASSGLPLTYTVLAGSITVNESGLVTPHGTGAVTLQISQPGNGEYDAAEPVIVTFVITSQPYRFKKLATTRHTRSSRTLAIDFQGNLWSWGYGTLENSLVDSRYVPELTSATGDWAEVSSNGHSLAIKTNGTLWAWGSNSSGQLGNGTMISTTVPVLISAVRWNQVSAGLSHSMAIQENGTLWAWGANASGQLGDGTTTSRGTPVQIGEDSDWKQVSAGSNYTLAIKNDGTLWAWGSGLLGHGSTSSSSQPIRIGADSDWKQVSAGNVHSLAIKRDGTLWAWGANGYGQLGDGTNVAKYVPIQIGAAKDWVSVESSLSYSLAVKMDGSAWAWGGNDEAQLGTGDRVDRWVPVRINHSEDVWRSVYAIGTGGIAQLADGSLLAWGNGSSSGKNARQLTRAVTGPVDWTSMSHSGAHVLLTKSDGTLWGFGLTSTGQLGINSSTPQDYIRIGSATTWDQVRAGVHHSGAILKDGSLRMWGQSFYGQLGDGSFEIRRSPVAIMLGSRWRELSLGTLHTAAIREDGTLWTWGGNYSGALGHETLTTYPTPVQIGTGTTWAKVSCGEAHTLALKSDGTLWATGNNTYGQLGLGNTTMRSAFTQVGSDNRWVKIYAASHSSFAIRDDGSLWAWGNNNSSQLGMSGGNRLVPTRVGTDNDWAQVAGSATWAAAIKADGTLWAWGKNVAGQQGVVNEGVVALPRQIGNSTGWMAVQAGLLSMVAMRTDGSLWTAGGTEDFRLTSASGRSPYVVSPVLPGLQPQSILPLPQGFHSGRIRASSGLPVHLEIVSGSGIVDGDHFTHTGPMGSTTVILAWQRGDETAWNATLPTQFSITTQSIDFPVIEEQSCGTTLVLNASASSGLPVSYLVTEGEDLVQLQGNNITFNAPGTVTIQATQPGGSGFAAAEPVSHTFTVVRGVQVLSFGAGVPSMVPYVATVPLHVTSDQGVQPILLSVLSGPGELDGNTLRFTSVGTVRVRATQAGNTIFLPAEAEIEITAFNTPPVALAGSFTGPEDVAIVGAVQAEDAQGTALTYSVAEEPNHGTLILSDNGVFQYTPDLNFYGQDQFSFLANDGLENSNAAVVTLNITAVNDAPVALPQTLTTPDSVPLAITLTGEDVEMTPLGFDWVTLPEHGTISGSGADWVYLSNPGYAGWDSLSFVVNDGQLASAVATISIKVTPVGVAFVTPPASQNVSETGEARFEVEVTGTLPMTYQWLHNGEPLADQKASELVLTEVKLEDAGSYQVEITNPVGTFLSPAAELRVIGGQPEIQIQPQHQLAVAGGEVTLSVSALGKPPLRYQWCKNGRAIRGATSAELHLPAAQLDHAGAYTVIVSSASSVTSEEAQVGIAESLGKDVFVVAGKKTSWSFKAVGKGLAFEWLHEGGAVPANLTPSEGGKRATLTNTTLEDAGHYLCKVTGPGGEVLAGAHRLWVLTAQPDITPLESGDQLPPTVVGDGNYRFEVPYDPDPQRAPSLFKAKGLPTGLSIDAKSGVITGRPRVSKDTPYKVKITAQNALGSDVVNVTLAVQSLPSGSVGVFVAPLPRHAFNDGLGGRLDITTTRAGSFSGKLTLGNGKPISFKGGQMLLSLDPDNKPTDPTAEIIRVPRPAPALPLELSFEINAEDNVLEGTLSDGVSDLKWAGWRRVWDSKKRPANTYDGLYNLGLEPSSEAGEESRPEGLGFTSLTVAKSGSTKMAGKTADGETLSGSAFLGPQGQVILHQLLYKNPARGSITGSLVVNSRDSVADDSKNRIQGQLSWFRPPASGRLYPEGFGPFALEARGRRYLAPKSPDIVLHLDDNPDNAILRFVGADVDAVAEDAVKPNTFLRITNKNKLVLYKAGSEQNPGRVTLKLNAKTGRISGTFTLSNSVEGVALPVQRKASFEGLIYESDEGLKGRGYFLLPQLPGSAAESVKKTPMESGRVILEAP